MRSQLFGFVVHSRRTFELLLDCSLQQVVSVMKQLLAECDGIVPAFPSMEMKLIHYLHDPLTVGFDAYLNEWDEEIVRAVGSVIAAHSLDHEWLRMERLRTALSWHWPRLRETTVLGQFVFATTIDNTILLTVTLGWNDGASPEDLALADIIMPNYLGKLQKLGIRPAYLNSTPTPEERATSQRPATPRMDTLLKLRELVAYRARHMQGNFVGIDKLQACADMNLAPKTVKKYAPTLYARWYDVSYSGEVA